MSNPESITVSLDWAKKLKEAGWPQTGQCFYWIAHKGKGMAAVAFYKHVQNGRYGKSVVFGAAPTAEEILRRLPEAIYLGPEREALYLSVMPDDYKWIVLYSPEYDQRRCDKENFWKRDRESLANASAAMYCYLAEKKLLPATHG